MPEQTPPVSGGAADAVVVVVGCGMQRYREYLLASASRRSALWLLTAEPPSWQSRYVAGSTTVDLSDRAAVVEAVRQVARSRPVRGVLSWDETLVVATAHACAALGLPGAGTAGIEGCRDKWRNRRLLTQHGLPQPRFVWVASASEAVAAAGSIGYPVVVKPRGMGASIGVVLAGDEAGVREAFAVAEGSSHEGAPAYRGGALVEEYLTGPEVSVDSAVVDGRCEPMFLARKRVGLYPFFEELGHVVDAADPLLADPQLRDVLTRAHRAAQVGSTITHTELKLTDRGPVIVEINGRLGGDLIPLLGRLATGIDAGAVAVDVATGRTPDLTPTLARAAGIRFGYPEQDCVVEHVELPPAVGEAGPQDRDGARLVLAQALADPGTTLRLPPNGYIARHSYTVCTAPGPAQCDAALDDAAARVHLLARPLAADPVPAPLP